MPEKNQPLKYVLIGVAITLGLGMCGIASCLGLVGGGAFWAYQELDAPAQQVELFLKEVGSGKLDAARERTSKRFQAAHTLDRFAEVVRKHPDLLAPGELTFPRRGVSNGRAHVSGVLRTSQGTLGIDCELLEENQAWKIDSLRLAGSSVE